MLDLPPSGQRRWPAGGGETGALVRAHDWAGSPLGPVEGWPPSRRAAVELALAHGLPCAVGLGPDALLIYNDAWARLFAARPGALGRPLLADLGAAWEPLLTRVRAGETVTDAARPAAGRRTFALTCCPLRDDRGEVDGIFVTAVETGASADCEPYRAQFHALAARYRDLFESIDEGFCIVQLLVDDRQRTVDGRLLDVNPAFARHTGLRATAGRTLRELLPAVDPSWLALCDEVACTGRSRRLTERSATIGRWFDIHVFRIGAPEERKIAVLFSDITARKRREAGLARLGELADDLSRLSTPDEIMLTVGAKLGAHFDVATCNFNDVDDARGLVVVHFAWNRADAPSLRRTYRLADYVSEEMQAAARRGQTVVVRDTRTAAYADTLDAIAIRSAVCVPFRTGGALKHLLSVTDTRPREWHDDEIELFQQIADRLFPRIERARAEAALRESRQQLSMALCAARMGTFDWDPATDRLTLTSAELFGLPCEQTLSTGADALALVHPDDRDAHAATVLQACVDGRDYRSEFRIVRADDGRIVWMEERGSTVRDGRTGEPRVKGVYWDISERKQAEDRNLLLIGELNHRVKNTLATVQSIAGQTLRNATSPAEFVAHFKGRLQALSRAHALLTRSSWEGAAVADIVHEQLALAGDGERLACAGDPAVLDAQSSLALALVLHELGTNARKYGALSAPHGRLAVTWTVADDPAGRRLRVEWRERDGPPVRRPERTGFGTALIGRSLQGVGGTTDLRFEPAGLECSITLPLGRPAARQDD